MDHRRLTPRELREITGFSQSAKQAGWFENHYGVRLPTDLGGPIISVRAFNGLMAKACGLPVASEDPPLAPRPQIKLIKRRTHVKKG